MAGIGDVHDDDKFLDDDGRGNDSGGYRAAGNDDDEPLDTARLDFDDESDQLPWLDAEEDDADESDGGRMIGFGLLGLIALGTIVGGIWWATHRTPDKTMVADGGIVAAPSQPYKEAPKNPGGKTFEGTGDTAFAVSEGQNRPARLGEASGAAAAVAGPGTDPGTKPPVAAAGSAAVKASPGAVHSPAATASPAAASTAARGPVVQVGAYSTRSSAEAAWSRLSGQNSALSGQRHQIVEGKADIGTVYRLQVLAADAQALCTRLKASGLACQVK